MVGTERGFLAVGYGSSANEYDDGATFYVVRISRDVYKEIKKAQDIVSNIGYKLCFWGSSVLGSSVLFYSQRPVYDGVPDHLEISREDEEKHVSVETDEWNETRTAYEQLCVSARDVWWVAGPKHCAGHYESSMIAISKLDEFFSE